MANCNAPNTGLTPLCDEPMIGLYGAGDRIVPVDRLIDMQQAGEAVVPRLRDGTVDEVRGTIVLLCIGMSNASMTATAMAQVIKMRKLHPRVKIVNACQFGQDLAILSNPADPYWTSWVPSKLTQAGVTAQQVGAIWCMEGTKVPASANSIQAWWSSILSIVATAYGNCQQLLVDAINYMGYSLNADLQEPGGYEQGVALRDWVIAHDDVLRPCVMWGAYLWCDGSNPRHDGFTWLCPADSLSDGVHPSNPVGSTKLANLVVDRLLGSLDTSVWAAP